MRADAYTVKIERIFCRFGEKFVFTFLLIDEKNQYFSPLVNRKTQTADVA